jgi:uncharacterized protein
MVMATFRFYEELNDFLPRARRGRPFASPCARAATTKHMIEALGVPHTEVALVLVNGAPGSFDQLIEEGDRIAAYPGRAGRRALPPKASHGTAPAGPRFVADAHLGGLARLLRMAGFDTLYDNYFSDEAIEAIAAREGRVVLTRDRELLKRRTISQGCYLHAIKPEQQLRELVDRLGLAPGSAPFSLCLHCNAPLRAVDRSDVLDKLPPAVRCAHDQFTTCDQCGRVYWKGSHWKRMKELLEGTVQC